ncbi:MAG: hypothetical protein GY765_27145 [bacterium]|nr:hypothetical protein [bacterium]
MKKTKSQMAIAKTIAGIMMFSLFVVGAFPYFVANESEFVYIGGTGSGGTKPGNPVIADHIIAGASYLLESRGIFNRVMFQVEQSGLTNTTLASSPCATVVSSRSATELEDMIKCATMSAKNAAESYEELILAAQSASYSKSVRCYLMSYDYSILHATLKDNSMSTHNGLFTLTRDYLCKGDMTGIFIELHKQSLHIASLLDSLSKGFKPPVGGKYSPQIISAIWRINQAYSEIILFGQFTAEIMTDAKKSLKLGEYSVK